jgi:hypothetical protein
MEMELQYFNILWYWEYSILSIEFRNLHKYIIDIHTIIIIILGMLYLDILLLVI